MLQANHRRHALLKHEHSGETWTGALTLGGTLTASGIVLTGLDIVRDINTSGLRLWGGNAAGVGAGFQLFGGAHATAPNFAYLDSDLLTLRNANGDTQVLFPSNADPVYTYGIKCGGHSPVANTGAGAEVLLSGGTAYYQGYNRTTSAYIPVILVGSTVYLYTQGNARVTVSSAGGVQFNNYGAGTLTTDASGNITAVSDERAKTNVRSFGRGLSDVLQLEPVIYRYNEASGLDMTHDYVGFVAQDVLKVIPEAVYVPKAQRSRAEMLTFSDRPVIASLVNAVKELASRVDALEA